MFSKFKLHLLSHIQLSLKTKALLLLLLGSSCKAEKLFNSHLTWIKQFFRFGDRAQGFSQDTLRNSAANRMLTVQRTVFFLLKQLFTLELSL